MPRSCCPMHGDEDPEGSWISNEVGWAHTCDRSGHVDPGSYTWFSPPPPPPGSPMSGIASDLRLDVELPAAMTVFRGRWVEYGVVERAYALANPKDWGFLLNKYGHTSIEAKRYTVSAFLARTLGDLSGTSLHFHAGPATGRWSYNGTISWWALDPPPDWSDRLSWEDAGFTTDYVLGQSSSAAEH